MEKVEYHHAINYIERNTNKKEKSHKNELKIDNIIINKNLF